MINFIKNLIYYLFNEVIEPNYLKLIKNLQEAKSMEEVINFHDKFLDTCLNEGLIIDNLKGKLNDILNCCYYYCHLIYQYNTNIRLKSQELMSELINKKSEDYINEYVRKTNKNKEKNYALKQAFLKMENEEDSIKLTLIYRKKVKVMNFYPKNMIQLRDYFLSIFDQQSSGEYIFRAYPNKNEKLTFEEGKNFNTIRKLKILKNPGIFIIDKDDEDYMNQIDKDNLKFIEEKLGFDLLSVYDNYDLNKVIEELTRKRKSLELIQKRVNLLDDGIKSLLTYKNLDEKKDIKEANINLQNHFNELNSKLNQLRESKMKK